MMNINSNVTSNESSRMNSKEIVSTTNYRRKFTPGRGAKLSKIIFEFDWIYLIGFRNIFYTIHPYRLTYIIL